MCWCMRLCVGKQQPTRERRAGIHVRKQQESLGFRKFVEFRKPSVFRPCPLSKAKNSADLSKPISAKRVNVEGQRM